jgi:hypothetical protein
MVLLTLVPFVESFVRFGVKWVDLAHFSEDDFFRISLLLVTSVKFSKNRDKEIG